MSNHKTNAQRDEAGCRSASVTNDVEWLKDYLLKTIQWKRYKGDGYALCRYVAYKLNSLHWFERCRTSVLGGRPVLLCEPNPGPSDDLSGPREFAELFDFDLMICERSRWQGRPIAQLMFVPSNHAWN